MELVQVLSDFESGRTLLAENVPGRFNIHTASIDSCSALGRVRRACEACSRVLVSVRFTQGETTTHQEGFSFTPLAGCGARMSSSQEEAPFWAIALVGQSV